MYFFFFLGYDRFFARFSVAICSIKSERKYFRNYKKGEEEEEETTTRFKRALAKS
jgi:hypothetical protein